ncbi:MAG: hypothetical protein AAFQ65_03550 [Myxococcota bacterium]
MRHAPTAVVSAVSFSGFSAAGDRTCALDSESRAWCWGARLEAVPEPTLQKSFEVRTSWKPEILPGLPPVTQVEAASRHICGVGKDEIIYCRGSGANGVLGGLGKTFESNRPVPGLRGVKRMVLGGQFGCAILADHTLACWGTDLEGQLGPVQEKPPIEIDGEILPPERKGALSRLEPDEASKKRLFESMRGMGMPRLIAVPRVESVVAGGQHACALTQGREVWCWGGRPRGFGSQERIDHAPRSVQLPGPVASMAADWDRTCALLSSGDAWCWQSRRSEPKAFDAPVVPVRTPSLDGARALVGGDHAICGRFTDELRCLARSFAESVL